MTKRQLVFIRPRRGSALERFQTERRADLPNLIHRWAEEDESRTKAFAEMVLHGSAMLVDGKHLPREQWFNAKPIEEGEEK